MSLVDPVANCLSGIQNSEKAAKKECIVRPASKVVKEILRVLQENKYVGVYEFVDDGREGMFRIELSGKINYCKAIKPRYAVKKDEFEKFEKRYLPSRDIGLIVVSTPEGVMSHKEAKKKRIGGRLLAFVY